MNTAAKNRIRRLLDQYDRLADRHAEALIAGRRHWAASRQRRLGELAAQITDLARRHGLTDWTLARLGAE